MSPNYYYEIIGYEVIMKKYLMTILMMGSLQMSAKAKEMWVYFDLGNTVINVKDKTNFHYFEGGREYISKLKQMGFKLGVISNIPESFGASYEEKLKTLKSYIKDKWGEDESFEWNIFDKIYLPLNNSELKPAPILYQRALDDNGNSKGLFISETKKEVDQAVLMGFAGHHYDDTSEVLYIPHNVIEGYIEDNSDIGDMSI